MNAPTKTFVPRAFHAHHGAHLETGESTVAYFLDAIQRPIQAHPIKFVVLTAWSAFFVGLLVKG